MRFRPKLPKGLTAKFLISYIVAFLIPSIVVFVFFYANAVEQACAELINSKKESMTTAKNYMENQFLNVESKNLLFRNVTDLYGLFDPTVLSEREIIYTYWKDFVALTKLGQYDDPSFERLEFYSSNSVAASILPYFRPMEELYSRDVNKTFRENPDQMLLRGFWQVSSENGDLEMTYYAGLMNDDSSRALGALSITCGEELLHQFFSSGSGYTATYLYWDGKLVYSVNASQRSEDCRAAWEALGEEPSGTAQASLDRSRYVLQSSVYLPNQDLRIVQFDFLPPDSLTGGNALWHILPMWVPIFLIATLVFFLLIFMPLRNVSRLARHLRRTDAPNLVPYPGKITRDEVGDLISAYNDLVNRTLQMKDALHENEILLRNAQIETLQSQLNPHFFYGTLESIRMIAEAHGETLISEISCAFGNLMRYSLSREYFVPLRREIEIVRQYLDIQKKRLGNRFSVEWKVDEGELDWDCPKFVLFSMIENVVVHDVGHTRKHVHILVTLRREGDDLFLSVENDGPGIPPDRLRLLEDLKKHPEKRKELSSQNNGRSIFNIHDRLRLYYGDEYEFSIQSEENVRTVCSVRFGVRPQKMSGLAGEREEETT